MRNSAGASAIARGPAILRRDHRARRSVQGGAFSRAGHQSGSAQLLRGQWRLRRQCRCRGRATRRAAALAGPLGGPAGEDSNGDHVLAALAREGVDCTGCPRHAGVSTALSAIFIDARGDRVIVTYRDERLEAMLPDDPTGLVASVDAVLADNRFPDFVRPICLAARDHGLPVVLDADRPTQMSDDLFRIATHVVFSSECLRATTGLDDLAAALARIADLTSSFLAVTQGAQDVLWREGATCAGARCSR